MNPLKIWRQPVSRWPLQFLLDGASAEFQYDHKVGLIGRNGSGKSRLIRVLLAEEELDKGEVTQHPKLPTNSMDLRTQMQSFERQMTKYAEKKYALEERLHGELSGAEKIQLQDEHVAAV